MFEVYQHTSPSGKSYVGVTSKCLAVRWRGHLKDAQRGSDTAFHNAIRKYGAGSFTHNLLERMTTEAGAKRAEQLWIKELRTQAPRGYNCTAGGDGVLGLAESSRAKMSAAKMGRTHPTEVRAKISAANLGRPTRGTGMRGKSHTAASRELMAAAAAARPDAHYAPLRGRPRPADVREKISSAQRGVPKSAEAVAKMVETKRRKFAEKKAKP